MDFFRRCAAALSLLGVGVACLAQPAVLASQQPAPVPAALPAVAAPAASAVAPTTAASAAAPEHTARRTVIEDRGVRIEETRIGGQAQRITVTSKLPGAKPYDITVGPAGRDITKDHGSAGQSAWSLFDF